MLAHYKMQQNRKIRFQTVNIATSRNLNCPETEPKNVLLFSGKRLKKSNEDPDWTPTTWYRTLYKKVREPKPPKPPKPPIKKTIDMLRYDRAKAIEKKKVEWKKPR